VYRLFFNDIQKNKKKKLAGREWGVEGKQEDEAK
jgi:hypothetical protein